MGQLTQTCVCTQTVALLYGGCLCARSFVFDGWARVFVAIHLYGLLWVINLTVQISRATVSSVVSLYYFNPKNMDKSFDYAARNAARAAAEASKEEARKARLAAGEPEEKEKELTAEEVALEEKEAPYRMDRSTVIDAYRRIVRYHMGSLILMSFLDPIVAVTRPLAHMLFQLRVYCGTYGKVQTFLRNCVGCCLRFVCCFPTIFYIDDTACLQQMALHGSSYRNACQDGSGLMMRSGRKLQHLLDVSNFFSLLGKILVGCVATGIGIAVVNGLQTTVTSLATSVPIFVFLAVFLIAHAVSSSIVDLYAQAVDALMLNFCEDTERNVRVGAPSFMPGDFRKYLDHFAYVHSGAPLNDPSVYWEEFGPSKLAVYHDATKTLVLHRKHKCSSRLTNTQLEAKLKEDPTFTWTVTVSAPYSHETQPVNHTTIFVQQPEEAHCCGLFHSGGIVDQGPPVTTQGNSLTWKVRAVIVVLWLMFRVCLLVICVWLLLLAGAFPTVQPSTFNQGAGCSCGVRVAVDDANHHHARGASVGTERDDRLSTPGELDGGRTSRMPGRHWAESPRGARVAHYQRFAQKGGRA
jgi:hypothetical protein